MEGVSSTGRVDPFDDAVGTEIGIEGIELGVCTIHRSNKNPDYRHRRYQRHHITAPNTELLSRIWSRIPCQL
jgi:hypothetical protein